MENDNEQRLLPHLTDAQVRSQLEAHGRQAGGRQSQPNPLSALMEDAVRALGYREGGSIDNPHRTPVPAASRTTIDLRDFIAEGNPAPNGVYSTAMRPAGESVPLDALSVIRQHSRVAEAGAQVVVAAPRDRALFINGQKTDALLGWFRDPALLRDVNPATFAALADGSSVTPSAFPWNDASFSWESTPTAAFSVTVTRANDKAVGGGEFMRQSIIEAILKGLGQYADSLLLAAIAAATPAAFSLGAASGQHLKFSDLRGLIGTTTPVGASIRQDGTLALGGVDAEFTAASAASYVGAFKSAGVALWPELVIKASRLNVVGDLDITVVANAQALLPSPAKFWTVA